MYDFVYVAGDSYASGCDLGEELYIDKKFTFSEWKPEQETSVRKRLAWLENGNADANNKTLLNLEHERSFGGQLARLLDADYKIGAVSGAGFTKIGITSFLDLPQIAQQHKKVLCLLTLTSAERFWFPGETGMRVRSDTIVMAGYNGRRDKLSQKVIKRLMMNSTHIDWQMQLAATFMGIIKFCETLNIDVKIVGTPILNRKDISTYADNGFTAIVDAIQPYYVGSLGGDDIEKMKPERIWTSGGHLPIDYHIKLAQEIKDQL